MIKREDKKWAKERASCYLGGLRDAYKRGKEALTDYDYDVLLEVVRYMASMISQERPTKKETNRLNNPILREIPESYDPNKEQND